MLRWRLALGVILVSALVALFWLDCCAHQPGMYLLPLALLVAALAAGEIKQLTTTVAARPVTWLVYGGTVLVVATAGISVFTPRGETFGGVLLPLLAVSGVVVAALVVEVIRFRRPQNSAMSVALTVFCVVYAGLLLSFLVQLRLMNFRDYEPAADTHRMWGAFALASMLIVVKMTDVGAYTVGRLVGRHKLAPALSPGKTIEGGIGGLVFAAIASVLAMKYLSPLFLGPVNNPTRWWQAVIYGLALAVAGTVGDLAESMLKREAGRKDSSSWMPGFGGVLDLLDSLLLAAPVAYFFWSAGLVGPYAGGIP